MAGPGKNGMSEAKSSNRDALRLPMMSFVSQKMIADQPRVVARAPRQDSFDYEKRDADQRPPGGGVPHRHY